MKKESKMGSSVVMSSEKGDVVSTKFDQITQKADDAEILLLDPSFDSFPVFGFSNSNKGIGMISGPISL
jgi:hypothetical protein